jgi:hypothetical protein
VLKSKSDFFKDSQSPNKVKNHCKECMKVKQQQFKKSIIIPNTYTCKGCNVEKINTDFDSDNTVKKGIKSKCKSCLSIHNKKISQSWDAIVNKKVVYSWKAHNNTMMENKLSIDDAMLILKNQEYKCAHCKHILSCETGDLYKKNYWGASLDRINVDIVGYANNAQWLCMSCNNGKNTMPNEEHLAKFKTRDDLIAKLLEENALLKDKLKNSQPL